KFGVRDRCTDKNGYGSGAALVNWNGEAILDSVPDPATTVLSLSNRGTANWGTLFPDGYTVYLENQNQDVCYAITVIGSGSIKLRKFSNPGWK
ncbi:MAG: hypothetical protein PF495_20935, partial [Spirochaetales bacterium]|nr:hypothetical protein [Spirochaetales bacterium]